MLCLRCMYCCIVLRGVDVGAGVVVCACIRVLICCVVLCHDVVNCAYCCVVSC